MWQREARTADAQLCPLLSMPDTCSQLDQPCRCQHSPAWPVLFLKFFLYCSQPWRTWRQRVTEAHGLELALKRANHMAQADCLVLPSVSTPTVGVVVHIGPV